MRENRTCGSEGGEVMLPDPYRDILNSYDCFSFVCCVSFALIVFDFMIQIL